MLVLVLVRTLDITFILTLHRAVLNTYFYHWRQHIFVTIQLLLLLTVN